MRTGNFPSLGRVSVRTAAVTTFTVGGLINNVAYRWAVKTVNSTGTGPVSDYTATATPGGKTATATGDARTATVPALANGTRHTLAAQTRNRIGPGPRPPRPGRLCLIYVRY